LRPELLSSATSAVDDAGEEATTMSDPIPERDNPTQPAGWRDQLVELHVLADHGDAEAAAAAAAWLAEDELARQAWDAVQRRCDAIRSGERPRSDLL
jgi:hypothetical protein